MCVCVCVCVYAFIQPQNLSSIRRKANFKQNLISLNLEFSFSNTSCQNKAEEPNLLNYNWKELLCHVNDK